MYTYEQMCSMALSDNYTLLYSFIGRELLSAFGVEGEQALREGTRRYGRDRGRHAQEEHAAKGYKVNMQTLFSIGSGLPKDPRFRRELQTLNPEERISHTLVCPMADIWKAYGEREIGRIYCEEFHPACYNHYGYDFAHTNLSKTLTQECDDYCAFNVTLRPQNLPEELREKCFAEYDPGYIAPAYVTPPVNAKRGFEKLCIKLYYYLLEVALEYLGEPGGEAVDFGVLKMAHDGVDRAFKIAEQFCIPFGKQIINDTYPMSIDDSSVDLWAPYRSHSAYDRFMRVFTPAIEQELKERCVL